MDNPKILKWQKPNLICLGDEDKPRGFCAVGSANIKTYTN